MKEDFRAILAMLVLLQKHIGLEFSFVKLKFPFVVMLNSISSDNVSG